ncbi:hypothetical protein [Gynuella sp.]|uniref:hypothetical protein n=1 Tax=Gynuella sp. TaxID=2969146 RepID=UPI003D0C48FA
MPIQLPGRILRTNPSPRLVDSLADLNGNMVAWWYCGLYKNQKAQSQPLALVAFRELGKSGDLSDQLTYRRVPITALGQVRHGSIWSGGMCHGVHEFETETFQVDFLQGGWKFTSFNQAYEEERTSPFPNEIYPLKYDRDRNWLIQFFLPDDGTLVIPCLEFFTRCYGYSGELRRILMTYPWEGTGGCEDRIFCPIDEKEEQGKWKIKLSRDLRNGDAIFAAHAKYDGYTKFAAKEIYSRLESSFDPYFKKPSFIRIGPWFRGPALIKVRGISFNSGKSFLGLQIVGSSDPGGVPIIRDRVNRNNAETPAGPDAPGNAWHGAPNRQVWPSAEILDLTAYQEPDHGSATVDVEDPEFEVLGEPRIVHTHMDQQAQDTGGPSVESSDTTTVSAGEPHGDKKGIDRASIHSRPVMESHGTLRDMWNAMLYLSKKLPETITSVEWFSFSEGFQKDEEPHLIALEAFASKDDVDKTTRSWPYMDPKTQKDNRGILVARINCLGKHIYIVEIQRRLTRKKNKKGEFVDKETYRGLVFILNDNIDDDKRDKWIRFIQSEVRKVRGVVQKLTKYCPGKAASFKHNPSSRDTISCEGTLGNALEKMGIMLTR